MVDALFAVPRLAEVYDALDPDRRDLDAYAAIVEELGASTILDVGCGTGTFACLLARRGKRVVGVDPAAASIDVARRKPGGDGVRWLVGDATSLPPLHVDLVTMTANVAQVFVTDEQWAATLGAIPAVLNPGGRLVFETRDPATRAWETWNREQSYRRADAADAVGAGGGVASWVELTEVRLPLVSFRTTFSFVADGAVLTSDSTLRFRGRAEVTESLRRAGFVVEGVRDAPDR
ncbi:MAG: class I SAM-dependent methyltransferase, partial [Acidimicrobiales bacterium]